VCLKDKGSYVFGRFSLCAPKREASPGSCGLRPRPPSVSLTADGISVVAQAAVDISPVTKGCLRWCHRRQTACTHPALARARAAGDDAEQPVCVGLYGTQAGMRNAAQLLHMEKQSKASSICGWMIDLFFTYAIGLPD
jgi:hypothetical protein